MTEKDTTELSKFLSYVLRHKPESIGLTLDAEGWASIEAIMIGAAKTGRQVTPGMVASVVETNDKKRFSLSEDGLKIRAVQGHSTAQVAIDFEQKTPPQYLYHGTATRFLDSILQKGLEPGNRQHVHLSADPHVAITVGARHGKPVVLTIAAADMHAKGHKFHQAENGVWLTTTVPAVFLAATSDSSHSK